MQGRWIALFALLCVLIPTTGPLISNASGDDATYEPGFVEWDVNDVHRIYLDGPINDVNLTRDYQAASIGNMGITAGQGQSTGLLSMPPL